MKRLQKEIHDWQRKTFPVSDSIAKFNHLKKEVVELGIVISWLELGQTSAKELADELADCFLLISGIASLNGIDLHDAAKKKLEINKKRKWGKADKHGVVEHLERKDE